MKTCRQCGAMWDGYGGQPRSREVCQGCGEYLHCCVNCHHFDDTGSGCSLEGTEFVGSRDVLNYCEEFRMNDSSRRAAENRVARAKTSWEELFRR